MEGLGKRLKKSESESHLVVSDSSQPHGLYCPWNSPGQNTGVDSLSLLQGIFPTQGSNPGLPHCRWILYQLSHRGSLGVLEWEAQEGCNLYIHTLMADSPCYMAETNTNCKAIILQLKINLNERKNSNSPCSMLIIN